MALNYLHGIETIEVDDGTRPIQTVKTAVIGLIGTAPDADPELYPINEPILCAGNQRVQLSFGNRGTIPDGLNAIFKQVGATVVIVRIEEGTSTDAAVKRLQTYANVVGNVQAKTGVHAFRKSNAILKIVPKIIICPGFTGERPADGLSRITVNTAGLNYTQANTKVTITGGGGQGAKANVLVNGSGGVQAVVLTNPGVGYTTPPTITIAGDGTGAAATGVIGGAANPVAVEMVALAPDLRAMVLVDTAGLSYEDAVAYRGDFDSQRIKIIEGGFQFFDANAAQNVVTPAAAYAAGKQAYMDQAYGFWWEFSNQPINGVTGVGRPIDWSYFDPNVEGQLLNSQDVAVCVHDDGFRIMGDRVPTDDSEWMFWSVRRTADAVYESIENALRTAVDRPLSLALIDWIEMSVNNYLGILKSRGAILDGKAWLDPDQNPAAQLESGNLVIDFDLEPPAPLERLTFRAHRNAGYYTELVNTVITNIAQTASTSIPTSA